jgi:hypothetical protein
MLKAIALKNFKNEAFDLQKTSSKMNLSQVFNDRNGTYLNELTLFMAHFDAIPNSIVEINISCKKAINCFIEAYKSEIRDFYFDKIYLGKRNRDAEYDNLFYFLYEDLLVKFDTCGSEVIFLFRKTEIEKVENVISDIRRFRKRSEKENPRIAVLVRTIHGIETKSLKISRPKLKIEDNYNDDFNEIHQTILKRLLKKNDKGLVLLHGKPGTGKTSYIRYLVSILKKDVIFLPPNMAGLITNPELISVLIDNPNSVFIIEDAENIIVDREKDGNSPVSALLNISDGLLADFLNIQIICSFNIDLSKVDSALMRKGRLIAKYEFKELEIPKAQKLSNKLGFKTDCIWYSPMLGQGMS